MLGNGLVQLYGFYAAGNINPVGIFTWNTATLSWEPQEPITGGGGGGGGAVTIADGADVAQGATSDAAGNLTVIGQLKKIAADQVAQNFLTDAQLRASPVPISGTVITGALTDTQLRASPVPISGTVVTGGLTDAQLRAAPVPISGSVTTGGLTDVQLRATPVPVSGPLTDTQLRAAAVPVSGPLTDAQLRAAAVPVSGPLTDAQLRAAAVPVSGPLTDAQLRAAAVSISYVPKASDLSVTVTGGANAIATATLPAAGPGLFHYITSIHIARVNTAALSGGAILTITTTNLNGRQWRTNNQASITIATQSLQTILDKSFPFPIKSQVANTATTIVCPAAGAAVSWQIVIDYFTGP
jgi:hypothetical protein